MILRLIPNLRTFFGRIIGQGGRNIRRILVETSSKVEMPHKEGDKIKIVGKSRESVGAAMRQVFAMACKGVSHFNIIRITNEAIINNYKQFKVNFSRTFKS